MNLRVLIDHEIENSRKMIKIQKKSDLGKKIIFLKTRSQGVPSSRDNAIGDRGSNS